MIVILNNGTRIKITKELAQQIVKALVENEGHRWHCITYTDRNEVSAFNTMHVATICSEEDLLPEPGGTLKQIALFQGSLSVEDAHGRFWAEKFRRFVLDDK